MDEQKPDPIEISDEKTYNPGDIVLVEHVYMYKYAFIPQYSNIPHGSHPCCIYCKKFIDFDIKTPVDAVRHLNLSHTDEFISVKKVESKETFCEIIVVKKVTL